MKESEFHGIQLFNIVHGNVKEIGVFLDDELPHARLEDLEKRLDRIGIEPDDRLGVLAFLLDLIENLGCEHHVILSKPDVVKVQGVNNVHEIEKHRVLVVIILLVV